MKRKAKALVIERDGFFHRDFSYILLIIGLLLCARVSLAADRETILSSVVTADAIQFPEGQGEIFPRQF